MSDQSQGPGWWEASDGRWYPPEQAPGAADPTTQAPWASPTDPSSFGSSGYGAGSSYGGAPSYGGSPYGGAPSWGTPPGTPGYPPAGWGAPPLPSANGMAIASMVLGILGVVPCFWNMFLAVIGLILGIIALRRINSGSYSQEGKGMAVAGIVLGAIGTVLLLAFLVLFGVSASTDTAMALGSTTI